MPILADPDVSGNDVARILRRMVCSECWAPLRWVPETWSFRCDTPGCTCQGMVSEHTVERREADDASNFRRAKSSLAEALGLPGRPAAKSASQLLAELGF